MSVIERTESDKLVRRVAGSLPKAYMRTIYYDGNNAISSMFKSLAGNIAILDISGLFRQSLSFGPTFQNVGVGAVTVQVALGDQNLSQLARISGNEAEIALYSSQWTDLAVLAPKDIASITPKVYTLALVTFASAASGELRIGSV